MKKHLVLMVSLGVILALGFAGFAQAAKKKAVAQEAVPEEAKRYFGQGKAIAKRAKSPQDFEEAIRLFEQAASLAPTWPDIYDDLAYAQENAEKYPEAIKSLRKYLSLAPSYADVKSYEVRIYELEEKVKYTSGPAEDVRLAKQWEGTWKWMYWDQPNNSYEAFFKIEVLGGIHVQLTHWTGSAISPSYIMKGYIKNGYFISSDGGKIKVLLSPDGMSWDEDSIATDGIKRPRRKIK